MTAKIAPIPRPDGASKFVIQMTEWDHAGPTQNPDLKGLSFRDNLPAQRVANELRSRVDIREGYQGLEINTTSYVGRVDVGPLRIAIQPKLAVKPLAQLLRYAYSLRDIAILEATRVPTARHGLHDLFILMLAAEVEELVYRGLARQYVPLSESVENVRGRILVDWIVRHGGIAEARVPCLYFERHVNWQLNQVLRAGLDAAAQMTEDSDLRRRAHRLAEMFGEVGRNTRVDLAEIDRAERGLTRLTAANRPALTLIRLLHEMQGVGIEAIEGSSRLPGFLFDMNIFFQRLLSRFLLENLTSARIEDQWAIRNVFAYALGNPGRRPAPVPRPDYALFRATKLCGFLDAKYRDIWKGGLPAEWLYQLSVYALASPSQISVLLYASMGAEAREERVEVRKPVSWSGKPSASVSVRPVSLARMAELLDPDHGSTRSAERRRWAEDLVVL